MNTLFKILILILIVTQVAWIYFIPPLYKFVIKYTAYKQLFPPEDIFSSAGDNVTVQLSLGKVIGTTIKPNLVDTYQQVTGKEAQPVHQFLGIPFAEPPLKDLRFKKPKPVSKWSPNVIEATQWKPNCLQNDRLFRLLQFTAKEFSEDCLYLNIWTPSLPSTTSTKLKPVFVWIYGGGFSIGGSSQTMYHGHILSSTQDMVVVTFNYRLGALGFLVSPDASNEDTFAPGNAALWDQVTALEWIQDNIKYFGGDPNQVTISGESAGSISVSALFVSPVTRNLFNNIITMSGSSLITTAFRPRETEVAKTRRLAEVIGCPSNDDKAMMKCLMAADGNKFVIRDIEVVKTFPGQNSFASGIMIFNPISGDDLIPREPKELFSQLINNQADVSLINERKKVRVLTGVVNWEGGIMRLGQRDKNSILSQMESTNTYYQGITNWLSNDLNIEENDSRTITETYLYQQQVGSSIRKENKGDMALFDLIGDYYLTCPAYIETELINSVTKSVHQYLFSFKPENNELLQIVCPDKDKVCHGTELGYFFGGPLARAGNYFYNNDDHLQAIETINLVGNFVRNEELVIKRVKPVKSKDETKKLTESVNWIKYDPKLKTSLEMSRFKNNPFVLDFRGKYCNLFRKYYLAGV